MNRILRYSLVALLAILCRNVSADTYTYTFESTMFSESGTVSLNGIDWTLDTDAGYFGFDSSNGRGQQIGSRNNPCTYATLSTTDIAGTITSVVVNASGASSITATLDVTVGGETFGDQQTLTTTATSYSFEGSGSGEIALNYNNSSSAAVYILSIEVTYTTDESYVAPPTINGSSIFEGETTVTITAGDGATIYYTTDGTEPTTASESGASPVSFTINATTTVKAMAVIDGRTSTVTTKEFTLVEFTDATIADLHEKTDDEEYIRLTLTDAKVTYVDDNDIYVREGDKAIIFYNTSLVLPVNAVLNGTVCVDYDNYYGIHEVKDNDFTNTDNLDIAESSEVAQPVDATISEILALEHICDYVILNGVTITSEVSGSYTNYYANADGERVQLYGGISLSSYANDGVEYNVSGLFNTIYNGSPEIQPVSVTNASADDVEFTDATIADLHEKTDDEEYIRLTLTDAKVTYVDDNDIYVREGDKAIIFYNTSLVLPVNAVLNGTVCVDYDNYYGIHEVKDNDFTNTDNLDIAESSEVAQPVDATISEILALEHICDYVILNGVTITSEVSGSYTNYYANADGERVQLYGGISLSSYANDGVEYNVSGLFNTIYNGSPEIQPVSVSEATAIDGVTADEAYSGEDVIYNLAGQRLQAPAKGINIINGKKVIVK